MCCKTDPKKVIVHVVSLSLIGMSSKGSYVSAEESNARLIAKVIFGVLFQFPFLFLPAGTLDWPAAWLYLLFFAFYALAVTLYLKRKSPELLRRRTSYRMPEKGWDKLFVIVSTIVCLAMFVIAPLDAVRYRWSQVPLALEALGFAGIAFSLVVVFLVMRENAYLFRTVQVENEQNVVTTGPYRIVRHPMYISFITMFFCIPLALGSFYALVSSTILAASLAIRTHFEDKELHNELKGYAEYAKKTRYRLIPKVW